jgi:transcriptional regulator with XRE-family HTH domain
MMTAENQGEAELTSQQKFNRLRPKAIVEVRLLSHAGADEKWYRAKIKDTNKEGAYCQIIDGPHTRFWHWREIRPCELTTGLGAISATLGEITQTHIKPVPELPRRDPFPPPQALRAALVPALAPSPPAPLVRLTQAVQRQAEQQQQAEPPTPAEPLTAGEMIRRARQAAHLSQEALAQKLSTLTRERIDNRRVSALETGFRSPSETEQIALAEALGIDLGQLIAACEKDAVEKEKELKRKRARETKQRQREERAKLEGREIKHRVSPYSPAAPKRAPSNEGSTLEDLIDALIAIVPLPLDADERKNWFKCARELFALSGGR